MVKPEGIELTEDPLTNIHIMIPVLNDREREAVSYFMYGCYVGGSIADKEKTRLEKSKTH